MASNGLKDDFNRAVFVALSLPAFPASSWDVQLFTNHAKRSGKVTNHDGQIPTGNIITTTFVIDDAGTSHRIVGTCDALSGATTFTVDDGQNLPTPAGFPQTDAGFEVPGSQIWFRYTDTAGVLQEYRLHTNTNLTFLANLLHINNFPTLAAVILKVISI